MTVSAPSSPRPAFSAPRATAQTSATSAQTSPTTPANKPLGAPATAAVIERAPAPEASTAELLDALETGWYAGIRDLPVGPLTRKELAARAELGDIDAQTLVWREEMPEWLPLRDVAALRAIAPVVRVVRPLSSPPPPPAPVAPPAVEAPPVVEAPPAAEAPSPPAVVELSPAAPIASLQAPPAPAPASVLDVPVPALAPLPPQTLASAPVPAVLASMPAAAPVPSRVRLVGAATLALVSVSVAAVVALRHPSAHPAASPATALPVAAVLTAAVEPEPSVPSPAPRVSPVAHVAPVAPVAAVAPAAPVPAVDEEPAAGESPDEHRTHRHHHAHAAAVPTAPQGLSRQDLAMLGGSATHVAPAPIAIASPLRLPAPTRGHDGASEAPARPSTPFSVIATVGNALNRSGIVRQCWEQQQRLEPGAMARRIHVTVQIDAGGRVASMGANDADAWMSRCIQRNSARLSPNVTGGPYTVTTPIDLTR